ncbi:MAG TPA: hypothetical protein VNO30_20550 [Kofleriaceae bacterium]|nr:hypothetical protein [Kofleriaceae bacterium]
MRRRAAVAAAALALALAACDDGAVRLEPVFELPSAEDALAQPTNLTGLVLSVAHAGSAVDLASRSFLPGERVELSVVPFDDDLVVHLTGQTGASVTAYGRTCTFSVGAGADPPAPHLWFARTLLFATIPLAPAPRTGGAAIELAGRALFLGGGSDVLERFDPRTGELTEIGQLAPRTGAVTATIGPAEAPRLAVVGGEAGGEPAGLLELIQPAASGPARIDRIEDVRLARIGATATALTDGRVVVIGGRGGTGAPVAELLELTADGADPDLRNARAPLAHPRSEHSATRLGDDVGAPVLIAGGLGAAGPVAVAELWKPLSGDLASPATFSPMMLTPRRGHRAELMPDGSVLMIGGIDGAGQPVRMLERFVIDAGFVPAGELPAGIGIVDITTTRLPDGRILIAGGRPASGAAPVDTAAIASLDVVNGAVSVVRTGDRLAVPRAGHHAVPLCDGTIWLGGGTAAAPEAERYSPLPPGRR